MQYGQLRSNRGPIVVDDLFFVKLVWNNTSNIITAEEYRLNPVPASVECETWKNGETHLPTQPKSQNKNKNKDHDKKRWNLYFSELPEWLQEFKENLVDERVPKHRDSHASSSSHEPSLEPQRRVVLDNHCYYTHFPKDRNCEICQRKNYKGSMQKRYW